MLSNPYNIFKCKIYIYRCTLEHTVNQFYSYNILLNYKHLEMRIIFLVIVCCLLALMQAKTNQDMNNCSLGQCHKIIGPCARDYSCSQTINEHAQCLKDNHFNSDPEAEFDAVTYLKCLNREGNFMWKALKECIISNCIDTKVQQ